MKKESSFNEFQKDYESKIDFELKNRISIFKNEIEPALNVEVNKSRTAECIEKSRYLSPDIAYWNAKLTQVRLRKLLRNRTWPDSEKIKSIALKQFLEKDKTVRHFKNIHLSSF